MEKILRYFLMASEFSYIIIMYKELHLSCMYVSNNMERYYFIIYYNIINS